MDVALRDLDLDAARAYIDSLPFFGTLSGTLAGAGFLDAMDVTLDWAFADARVPGMPVSRIAGNGIVGATRDSGLTFTNFVVGRSDVDLRTVRRLAPAVIVEGRLAAEGTLDGPLRNVTFRGTARQQDGDRPASTANGTVYLDTRADSLRLATDVVFDPLSFDGIRRAFPSLETQGDLRGRFRSEGTLSRLAVDADLTGDLGDVQAQGFITVLPPYWGADGLRLVFSRLDLAALTGGSINTSLAGELRATGVIDTARAPEGTLELALTRSRVREWTLDSLFGRGGVHDSVIRIDTAYAEWKGARAAGGGTLGWRAPHAGRMRFDIAADSLIGFDSLLLAMTRQKRDTSVDARPLGGRAEGRVDLAGSLDSLQADGTFAVDAFQWQRIGSPRITGSASWLGGRRPRLTARVATDSIRVQQWVLRNAGGVVNGFADSLGWSAGTNLGDASRFDGTGHWYVRDSARVLRIDTLLARLAVRQYRLEEPVVIALADSAPSLTPLRLRSLDGSSLLQAAGRVPGTAPGDLQLQLLGLDVHDFYGLLQRDTSGVNGEIELDLQVGGTSAAPTFRGLARLADGRFGDFQSPFVQGVLNYGDRRLDANLDLWRTGENLLQIEAHLPLDLAFTGVEKRQIDGPLSVRAQTDSVSLGLLEAITPAVTRVGGTLKADVQVGGTWAAPRLAGRIDIDNGSMSLPGLGIRFGGVRGGATLEGDSVRLRNVVLTSGGGQLAVGGSVRLENLSHPILNLTLRTDQFRAIDVRSFLTLVATGDLQLRGPVFGAALTGELLANSGVLYFADLVNKRIIDLEDPSIADLVDTTLIRRENLGAKFQNRFLDSLRIEDLRVEMGSDVWLRSAEANIQLEGRVRLSKQAATYNPTGTLNAPRGTYTLKIGPVTRDFTVNRGQVTLHRRPQRRPRHRGAAHGPEQSRGDEIPIVASISGTLYQPKLTLEQHHPPADLRDRPRLVPHHRVSGERGHAAGAGRRAPDRPGLFLERALERARARPDPGHRGSDRPDRDPAGRLVEPRRRRIAHAACGRVADRQEDLPDLQRRLLSRLQPAELQEPRRQPRVPLQPRVEAADHGGADDPVVQQLRHRQPVREHQPVPDRLRHPLGARVLVPRVLLITNPAAARTRPRAVEVLMSAFAARRVEGGGHRHRRSGRCPPPRGRGRRAGRGDRGGLRWRRDHDAGGGGAGRHRRRARRHSGRHRATCWPATSASRPRRRGPRGRSSPRGPSRSTSAAWSAPDGDALLRRGLRRRLRRAGDGGDPGRAQAPMGDGGLRRDHPPAHPGDPEHRARHHDRRRGIRRQRGDGAGGQLRRGDPAVRPARRRASAPTTGCSTSWWCGPTASGRASGPSGTCSGWRRSVEGLDTYVGYARGREVRVESRSRAAGAARRRGRRGDPLHGDRRAPGHPDHGARERLTLARWPRLTNF